jgi:hypothetical protein
MTDAMRLDSGGQSVDDGRLAHQFLEIPRSIATSYDRVGCFSGRGRIGGDIGWQQWIGHNNGLPVDSKIPATHPHRLGSVESPARDRMEAFVAKGSMEPATGSGPDATLASHPRPNRRFPAATVFVAADPLPLMLYPSDGE